LQHYNLYFEHKQYLILVLGLISKQLLHPFHVYGHIMLKAPVLVRSLLSTDVCE